MNFSATIRRLGVSTARLRRIVAVAAFLLAVSAAGRADASCGDWLAGHGTLPEAASAYDDHGPQAPAPCDGPGCRRSQEHAPAVPPAPTRQLENSERWCRLAEELTSRPPLSSSLPPQADQVPARGFEPRVDRPPRV